MKNSTALLALGFTLIALPAKAERIPDYVLDHDFVSCMGNESAQTDPQRAEYCNCTREAMRNWDMETYGAVAGEQAKASSKEQVPAKIGEIAKACIEKILK